MIPTRHTLVAALRRRVARGLRIAAGGLLIAGCALATAGSYEDFFAAVKNDNAGTVKQLLQRGFDANTRDSRGQTGLMLAIREQSPKAAKALLDQPGTEIDALNQAGESALMLAALKGDLAMVRALLERGARVNQPGWTALHYAATGPEPQVVRLLIERGAALDAGSPNLTTPLMMAAQYGAEDSIKLLLQRGADPSRRNQQQLSAADFARLAQRDALAQQLQSLQR